MTYEEIVSYIERVPRFTEKHSLSETRRILEALGNPDRNFPAVHVAGTNGKGSVCAFLSSIFGEAGLRTAMFTSPHLRDMRERMQISGNLISREAFAEAFERVMEAVSSLSSEGIGHPSYFELLYLMACCCFSRERPDIALIEVGLGGRLDATNTLERPLACVITSVSLDHMEYLGGTIPEIASEKAGILKKGVPAIAWCEDPEAYAVFKDRAKAVGAELFPLTGEDIALIEEPAKAFSRTPDGELFLKKSSGIDFSVRSGYDSRQIRLHLPGSAIFQTENAALAVRTAEVLAHKTKLFEAVLPGLAGEPAFDAGFLRAAACGIAGMSWPCRMEELLPDVYLDGAHNEDGIRRFAESMERILSAKGENTRFVLLFGAVKDKDYGAMIRRLADLRPALVVATEVPGSRRASAEDFAQLFKANGIDRVLVIPDEAEAYAAAYDEKMDGVLGICGSLYLAGALLGADPGLRADDPAAGS